MKTIIPKKGTKKIFDWSTLNWELFRGKDLTFPISATVMIVPEFDDLVIAAMDTFPRSGLVDPEEIKVHILYPWERGEEAPKPFNEMNGSDLGLRLHYIEGDWSDYVLCLRTENTKKEFQG